MAYQTKKVTFLIDELTMMKLETFMGDVAIKDKDYQLLIQKCINKTYDFTKGKKL
jgi:hypothetical protein